MTDGEPETVVSASLQKKKSIKNPIKHFFIFFISLNLKLVTHLFNHFDGHFAYLKTLDFYFNCSMCSVMISFPVISGLKSLHLERILELTYSTLVMISMASRLPVARFALHVLMQ